LRKVAHLLLVLIVEVNSRSIEEIIMDIQVFNLYRQAEEIYYNENYGDTFLLELNNYYEKSAVSLIDLTNLISFLVRIDETRDVFHVEIKKLLFFCIKNNECITKLIDLLEINNQKYDFTNIYSMFFKNICLSVINQKIDMNAALMQVKEIK
jgi:hypothetical protein